jgi:hypothetical protein
VANVNVNSVWRYADGNVYVGLWGGGFDGIKRYSVASGEIEEKYWTSARAPGVMRDAFYMIDELPVCLTSPTSAICPNRGGIAAPLFNTTGGRTLAVVGIMSEKRELWQMFPTLEKANVDFSSVSSAEGAGDYIVVAGLDGEGANRVSVYDTITRQETVVINESNEIEIYSMSFDKDSNSVLFSGLRFSDNQYVMGEIFLG